MKNFTLALALAAALTGARSASAGNVNLKIHGNSCFNTTPGTNVYYSQWGAYNPSTTTGVTVNCPLNMPDPIYSYVSMYVQVYGYSRNNSANQLSCTLTTTDYSGYIHPSATAVVNYYPANVGLGTATYYPPKIISYPYLSCYIPPNNGNGISYLTTLGVIGTY